LEGEVIMAATKKKVCKNCGRIMPATKSNRGVKARATARSYTRKKKTNSTRTGTKKTRETAKTVFKNVPPRAARYVILDGKKQYYGSSRSVEAASRSIVSLEKKHPRRHFRIYDKGA
jgi:hypothetical protein